MEKILGASMLEARCQKASQDALKKEIAANKKAANKQAKRIAKEESSYCERIFLEEVEDFLEEEMEFGKTSREIERDLYEKGWVFKPGVGYTFFKVTGCDLRDLVAEAKEASSERKAAMEAKGSRPAGFGMSRIAYNNMLDRQEKKRRYYFYNAFKKRSPRGSFQKSQEQENEDMRAMEWLDRHP